MPWYFPSSIIRALIAVTVFTIVAVYAQIYFSTAPAVERLAADAAQRELIELHRTFAEGGKDALEESIARRAEVAAESSALYALADQSEKVVAGNIREWPWNVDYSGAWQRHKQARTADGSVVRMGYRATILSGGHLLLVGRDMSDRTQLWSILQRSLVMSAGVALVCLFLSSIFLSVVFERRMIEISNAAEDIMRGNFARRVPIPLDQDEFASLGESINMMLERIEALMRSTRMVTDSIAHHVRGSLTRLKTRLEAIAEQTSEAKTKEDIEAPIAELAELLRILDGLIEIARADAGLSRDQMKPVAINRLIEEMVEIYGPLADENDILLTAELEDEVTLVAHEALLAQALSNLIENSIKYIGAGGKIVISAATGAIGPVVSVADNGPGIPADQRSRAIARFSRLGGAKGKDGVGLGLSIVAAIARLHRADFMLEDNLPGLRAMLRFPPKPVRPAFWSARRWLIKRN